MMKSNVEVGSQTERSDLSERRRDLASALDELNSVGKDGIEANVGIYEWGIAKRAVPVLVGRMKGHPTIKDGNVGATTEIFFIDTTAGLARSFNRWYRLGPGSLDQSVPR